MSEDLIRLENRYDGIHKTLFDKTDKLSDKNEKNEIAIERLKIMTETIQKGQEIFQRNVEDEIIGIRSDIKSGLEGIRLHCKETLDKVEEFGSNVLKINGKPHKNEEKIGTLEEAINDIKINCAKRSGEKKGFLSGVIGSAKISWAIFVALVGVIVFLAKIVFFN